MIVPQLKSSKHAPSHFSIEIRPQYLSKHGLLCHPGSVFEGVVKLTLHESFPIDRLKVVFKATERVNYDAMGWEKIKNDDGRLFAVRTHLLGGRASENAAPVHLSAGSHTFNFAIELPLVNFPPSLDHHLIGCTFMLFACLDVDSRHTFKSEPFPVVYRPALCVAKPSLTTWSTFDAPIQSNVSLEVRLPSLEYNLEETRSIPLEIRTIANSHHFRPMATAFDPHMYQLRVTLKRSLTILHRTYRRTETSIVSHRDLPLPDLQHNDGHFMELALDAYMLPTVDFSTRFNITYSLQFSLRVKHGPLSTRKKLFDLPIDFGTLSPGSFAMSGLQVYTDVQDPLDMQFKPKFLQASQEPVEYLPPYESLERPPSYCRQAPPHITAASSQPLAQPRRLIAS
ncbi:hypothetical protein BC940DRAFT_307837 [Gongronella butleri]|nr:hypothetical protein BC940DRAFT_307837 [Gongronella butleri]